MIITQIIPLTAKKVQLCFDCAEPLVLYKNECQSLALEEQAEIDNGLYQTIFYNIVGKRAVKRAMHLLEKMDRTEWQLRKKLEEGQYPPQLIDKAVEYVKSYHYIDDERYARTFVRIQQAYRSTGRMRMDLLSKGIAREIVDRALEEENETPQGELIQKLLAKKAYNKE